MNELEKIICTVCGSSHSKFLFEKQSKNSCSDSIFAYRCNDCNCIFLGKLSSEYKPELYEYYRIYQGQTKDVLFNSLTTLSYHRVLDLISLYSTGKDILDVGCGKGDFVYAGRQAGWNVNGIELSQTAVEIAQSFDLPVKKIDFFSSSIYPDSYDIVTMFEVLEHLSDPVKFINRAAEIVKPGGLIYLTTPNYESFDRWILGISWPVIHREHLTYFSPKTLNSVIINNTNLNILHLETRNLSIQFLHRIVEIFQVNKNKQKDYLVPYSNDVNEKIRKSLEVSLPLQLIKRLVNKALNITSSGSTIVLLLKRPL